MNTNKILKKGVCSIGAIALLTLSPLSQSAEPIKGQLLIPTNAATPAYAKLKVNKNQQFISDLNKVRRSCGFGTLSI